ncbi:ferredoxin [Nocardia sp. NBC_01499]|uniref:ferredoxin n=1 Tax=Nocardia sp. NBC_01499 TaxID=2903597 RepID=UPI00386D185B
MDELWRIEVDRRTCIGSGMCNAIAPAHFSLVDGHSSASAEPIRPDDLVIDAVHSCPVEALRVRAFDTGKVLAPEG